MAQRHWWDHLPSEEIWVRVLKWDYSKICDAEDDSSKFKRVIGHPLFWRMKMERDFPFHNIDDIRPKYYRSEYEKQHNLLKDLDTDEQRKKSQEKEACEELDTDLDELTSKMHHLVCDIERIKKLRQKRASNM